jgi:hypothetical protein
MTIEDRPAGPDDAQDEPGPAWYWCPNCKLASAKAGSCAGCALPYEPVPSTGVPATAYVPQLREGPSRLSRLLVVLLAVLAIAAVIAGLIALAAHGDVPQSAG